MMLKYSITNDGCYMMRRQTVARGNTRRAGAPSSSAPSSAGVLNTSTSSSQVYRAGNCLKSRHSLNPPFKVHYCIRKCPLLHAALSYINLVHKITPYFFKTLLLLNFHSCLGIFSSLQFFSDQNISCISYSSCF